MQTTLCRFAITFSYAFAFWSSSCLAIAESDKSIIEKLAFDLLNQGTAGISFAIVNRNGKVWSDAYGYADIKDRRRMTTDTIMNIASISKTLTGAAVMSLVEAGQLDLDKDINTYLPMRVTHPKFPKASITLRQILTHTSGIIDRDEIYGGKINYHLGGDNPIPLHQFLDDYLTTDGEYFSHSNFSNYPPGTDQEYSNIAYGLAGLVVEHVAKMPLNEFTHKVFFEPLGMASTGWMLAEVDARNHASLYEYAHDNFRSIGLYGIATWPDGGLRTSVDDFSKFLVAMANRGKFKQIKLFERKTIAEMLTPQLSKSGTLAPESGAKRLYGQAITWSIIESRSGERYIGHTGGDPGVNTFTYFAPSTQTGAVLFINTENDSDVFYQARMKLLRGLLSLATKHQDAPDPLDPQ